MKRGKDALKRRVAEFNINNVSIEVLNRVRSILSRYDLETVQIASIGAATFFQWVGNYVLKCINPYHTIPDLNDPPFNPLTDDNFRLFQTERVCRQQFQFDENGRKLAKRVENTAGKGEIARYEQFLLSHSVFKSLVSQGRQKVSLCGNGRLKTW